SVKRANLLGVGAIPQARERFVATGKHIPPIGRETYSRNRTGGVACKRAQNGAGLTVLQPDEVIRPVGEENLVCPGYASHGVNGFAREIMKNLTRRSVPGNHSPAEPTCGHGGTVGCR